MTTNIPSYPRMLGCPETFECPEIFISFVHNTFKMWEVTFKIINKDPVEMFTQNFVVSVKAGAAHFIAIFFALICVLSSNFLNTGLDSFPGVVRFLIFNLF